MIPYNLQLKPPLGTPLNRGHKLAEGLVGLWLMNEGVGSQTFDSSGNVNTGTFSGNPQWVSGIHGSAIDFDGIGDKIDLTNSITIGSNATVVVWIKFTGTPDDVILGGAVKHIFPYVDNTNIYTRDGGVATAVAHGGLNVGQWYQIAVSQNGTASSFYLDDLFLGLGDVKTPTITEISGVTALDPIIGQLDYIILYGRGLSASEIALLYSNPFIMFKDPAETALLGGYVEVVGDWIGINSSHLDSHCGDFNASYSLAGALDGTQRWVHAVEETHEFILDLAVNYNITKVRSRSQLADDPIDVDIYISETNGNWGVAVATGISTWQDTVDWVEIDNTDKTGRYMRVVINTTEDAGHELTWGTGGDNLPIFDVYGEVISPVGNTGIMTTNTGFWGPTF